MNEYLRGKSAIVTGASSGIGREIALAFSREGANVLAVARRQERLDELNELSERNEGEIVSFVADLQDKDSYKAIVAQALSAFDTVDILVNNAAFGKNDELVNLTEDEIEGIIQTNLLAPAFLSKEVLPLMIKKGSGHIIYVTSLAGKLGFPGLSAYSASKFGVEGLAEAVRREVRPLGITVTVLRPGVTDTEFFDKANMQDFHAQAKKTGKLHQASKVAEDLVTQISSKPNEIVVGSDKWFLRIMPFIPEKLRMRALQLLG
jgi:short-subunit dehydrogenase